MKLHLLARRGGVTQSRTLSSTFSEPCYNAVPRRVDLHTRQSVLRQTRTGYAVIAWSNGNSFVFMLNFNHFPLCRPMAPQISRYISKICRMIRLAVASADVTGNRDIAS